MGSFRPVSRNGGTAGVDSTEQLHSLIVSALAKADDLSLHLVGIHLNSALEGLSAAAGDPRHAHFDFSPWSGDRDALESEP